LLNILITSSGGNGAGNQVAKSLIDINKKYNLFLADNNPNNIQFRDQKLFELPLVSNKNYLEEILLLTKENGIQVIVPGSDRELLHFAENIDFYRKRKIFIPINNIHTIRLCSDKSALNNRLEELGFNPPKSLKFSFHQKLPNIDWYPVILKPLGESGGSANVFIAQNEIELNYLLKFLKQSHGNNPFIIQEYVGTPDSEYTVGILHDQDGNFIDSIALKRDLSQTISVRSSVQNYSCKTTLGEKLVVSSGVSQGIIGKFPDITTQCRNIAESIGSTGPLNFQCRLVENKVKVFEINPRFSGTSHFRSLCGFNEVDSLLELHFFKKNINRDNYWDKSYALRTLEETIFKTK